MILPLSFIIISLLVLFVGAECLVRGSASLASRAGLSSLMIGLTIVSLGTSSPELVVAIKSALAGQGDIAVGNVVGSNSLNIGLILGLTALICPIPVHRQVIKLDAPLALLFAIVVPFMFVNSALGRVQGILLVSTLAGYILLNFFLARRENASAAEEIKLSATGHWVYDWLFMAGGLGCLILGSNLLVNNSVLIAQTLGVSEAVIGLTIVAAGTSMPELATSVIAAFRKQPDIAIGNIVGSNIFNLLGILGLSGLVAPFSAPGVTALDFIVMIAFSLLLLPLLWTGRILHRIEGVLLLGGYLLYVWHLWPKAPVT
jgi:cation:H+ antiporter